MINNRKNKVCNSVMQYAKNSEKQEKELYIDFLFMNK